MQVSLEIKEILSKIVIAALLCIFISPAYAEINLIELPRIKALKINNDRVITSGLPTDEHFPSLRAAGIDTVINLIPLNNRYANPNEAISAAKAGVTYINIEVDWEAPTIENVEQFFAVMTANKQQDVLVHCAANYRASAFYYLYQVIHEGVDAEAAFKVTLTPWGDNIDQSLQEYPQWSALIESVKAKYQQQ